MVASRAVMLIIVAKNFWKLDAEMQVLSALAWGSPWLEGIPSGSGHQGRLPQRITAVVGRIPPRPRPRHRRYSSSWGPHVRARRRCFPQAGLVSQFPQEGCVAQGRPGNGCRFAAALVSPIRMVSKKVSGSGALHL